MRKSFVGMIAPLAFAVLFVSLSRGAAGAQERVLDQNAVVSSDGDVAAFVEKTAVRASLPSKGSGVLAAGGALRIPAAKLNVPSLDELRGVRTKSVIGPDGRTRVSATTSYPNSAIVYLYVVFPNDLAASCTGWMIGPRTVATAGHCVYSAADGGWAKIVEAYPGRNGYIAPFGSRYGFRLFSVHGWTQIGNEFFDYGAIQLDGTAIGSTTGWFGFRWQPENTFPGAFRLRGYPGDKPSGTMWTMGGPIYSNATYAWKIWYPMDTYGGQSGSPVFQYWKDPRTGVSGHYGVGIHTNGAVKWFGGTALYNSGTRITQAVFNNLLSWKNRVYP